VTALRLDLTVATYPEGDRWTWTLHAGRHIVSSSGGQLFSRRIDCARGAEVGAGLTGVREALRGNVGFAPVESPALRRDGQSLTPVAIRLLDARGT
jgi:hypothetical protein